MAKFRKIAQNFLTRKALMYWKNLAKNYREPRINDDFFLLVSRRFPSTQMVELIQLLYTKAELQRMMKCESRFLRLDFGDETNNLFASLWADRRSNWKARLIAQAVADYLIAELGEVKREPIEERLDILQRTFNLSDLEREILLLNYIYATSSFDWPQRLDNAEKPLYFAMAIDCSYGEALNATCASSKLRRFNLLDNDWDFNRSALEGYLEGSLGEPTLCYYKHLPMDETLPWHYFGALAEREGALLERLIANGRGRCNILFYGVPGTGKTSFAQALAKRVGRNALAIRQGETEGKAVNVDSRLFGIQLCNLREAPDESLMIIDEAEELLRSSQSLGGMLFGGQGGKSTEKGVINSLLDTMNFPTIWISNAPSTSIDESVRRRFDYAICFEALNTQQRCNIWRNVIERLGLEALVRDEQVPVYAARYETSAGGIAIVLENLKHLAPKPDEVDGLIAKLMAPHCKLLNIRNRNTFLPARDYALEGLSIKGRLAPAQIVEAARRALSAPAGASAAVDAPRMTLLLFGPPGSGKTEFVKYLGQTLDRKVLCLKGSDILSKWVGESEQRIAAAFRQAENEGAILFFDEIDGLMQSREMAQASWEVSRVNEFLQHMENFEGMLVAATNFRKHLDPAMMRRFTFKLEFGYLDDAGKRRFFERAFHSPLTPAQERALAAITRLTPGDFRTVRQAHYYLGEAPDNERLLEALRAECALKTDLQDASPIGFTQA